MKRAPRPRQRCALAVLASALVLSGCATPGDDTSSGGPGGRSTYEFGRVGPQGNPGKPVRGGSLTFADYTETRSLDPTKTIANGASGGTVLAAVYDVLMRWDEKSAAYEPWLAKDLTSNKDHTVWTLKLRDGVRFSDGTTLDAKAVTGSMRYFITHRGSDASLLSANIEKMTAEDDSTVVFRLRRPWASFPTMLAQGPGMIVAPAAVRGKEFKPIGAGPFTLRKYAPQEEMTLSARRDYWDGAPYLRTLRFIWPSDDEARLDALESGSADASYLRTPKTVDKALRTDLRGSLTQLGLGNVLLINNRKGRPGEDVRVRRALAYATDPVADYDRAYSGAGMPGLGLFQKTSRWHTGVPPRGDNPAKARKLLAAAKKDGYDGRITYMDGTDPLSRAEAITTKALLERAGFTVELDLVRSVADQTKKAYVDHDFDLSRNASSVSEADPFPRLHSMLVTGSELNAMGYSDATTDKLLRRLQGAASDGARKALLKKIEERWHTTVPAVAVGAGATFVPWNENVRGVSPSSEEIMLLGNAWKTK